MIFTCFDKTTGGFSRMIDITVSENIPPDQYLLPNEMMVSGSYPGCFFDFDAKDPRPLMNMALSVSENLLKGIPEGSEVLVMDVPSSNVSGGTLFIDVDLSLIHI